MYDRTLHIISFSWKSWTGNNYTIAINHEPSTDRWISKQTEISKKLELLSYLVLAVFLTVKFQNVKCAALIMWKAVKKGICKLGNLSKSMRCTKLVVTLFSNQLVNHTQNIENFEIGNTQF